MLKVNEVKGLTENRKAMTYSDLETGDCFLFVSELGAGEIVIKTKNGHMWLWELRDYTGDEGPSNPREVMLVDAELNWAYRGGAK